MGSEARSETQPYPHYDSDLWERAAHKLDGVAEAIARGLRCDVVCISMVGDGSARSGRFAAHNDPSLGALADLFVIRSEGVFFRQVKCPKSFVVHDVQRARLPSDLGTILHSQGVRSFGIFPIYLDARLAGIIACYFKKSFHRWTARETESFQSLAPVLCSDTVSSVTSTGATTKPSFRSQYQRLATHGNIVIVTTDSQFQVTDIFGNTESLIGISPQSMRGVADLWERIIDPRDIPLLKRRIMRLRRERTELREELRFVHQKTGQSRWLMLRALPQFSPDGQFIGWEGFGVDVTDRRHAQDRLLEQNQRLEALFEVAAALHGYADPAAVTFKGLRAIVRATQADSGYACFYDRDRHGLEVVAAVGLPEDYLRKMEPVLRGPSILCEAVAQKRSILIDNLQEDARANRALAKVADVRAALVIPMIVDDQVCGALVLFKREAYGFEMADLDLAAAAAAQIALSIRQAEMFELQKRQSAALSSLYKLSQQLAKHRSALDFSAHIFPILKDEFALKRGWVGVLNEQQTFLLTRASFGLASEAEGLEPQIEVTADQHVLHQVLETQLPVVIHDPENYAHEGLVGALPSCSSLVVVPMVSIGQVLGVLVVEPLSKNTLLAPDRVGLLASMANEIATVMMANRFETKMSEALRMRTAGVLAAGVAHNFNNLLQAILGQVSLIEMQTPKSSPIISSSQTITEAAKRGAALVSQLLNFANNGNSTRKKVLADTFTIGSEELYRSLIGKNISFSIKHGSGSDGATVVADGSQMQQVLTNMLMNAKEAISSGVRGEISISTRTVTVRSGELAPDVQSGPYVRIDVRDNGVGMTVEQQARCFEPFYTTKNVDQGTGVGLNGSGLGLSTAYSIVKQHGGVITVHSVPGEGSLFSIYLPLVESGASARLENNEYEISEVQQHGVLLLGMEIGVQPFLSSVLESLGYVSRGVYDARQAIDVLRREPECWRIVMVDVEGLGPNLVPVCTQLLNASADISIVCVGGASAISIGAGSVLHGLPETRVTFIDKPLSVWSVEASLHRLRVANDDAQLADGQPLDVAAAAI